MAGKVNEYGLTEKQEAACQAYIECEGNQSAAYRIAYNCENQKPETIWSNASELFANSKVIERVLELQAMHAERHNVTVDTITKELDENRDIAKEEKQSAAMTAATLGKAKIHGLITDQKRHSGAVGIIDLSVKTDEELKKIISGS